MVSFRFKELFKLVRPVITWDDLRKAKNEGYRVTKHSPFGLTERQYGNVYLVDGFRFFIVDKLERP